MNNAYVMSASLEAKYRQQASMITAGFSILMLLIMFLLKWQTPTIEPIAQSTEIDVEITLPPDPPEPPQQESAEESGGGGGNVATASGPVGVAPETAPTTSKDWDEDNDKDAPVINKPKAVAEKSPRINEQSIAKAEPKPIVEPPAPKAKAQMGKNVMGTNKGGGGADDYGIAGGRGNGTGVGNGNGTGGGTGNGNGGGNGNGTGGGSGPKVTNGDRKVVRFYSFQGDLDKATVYANVNVSPEGLGKFVSIAKGSSNSSNAYKTAIMQYLQNIRFDKSDHESMVTVRFNFEVN